MKKRCLFLVAALMVFSTACAFSPVPNTSAAASKNVRVELKNDNPDELDAAIREASDYLNGKAPKGKKLAILNIKSDWVPLSEYVIDILMANIVNDGVFTVVDRANLAQIQAELDFQLSGEVSDESAKSIGQKLGADTIVSGSVVAFGSLWRITVRALEVETATVQGIFNRNIPNGMSVAVLTSGAKTVPAASGTASAPGSSTAIAQSSPAAAVVSATAQSSAASTPVRSQASAPVTARSSVAPATVQTVALPVASAYRAGDAGPAGGTIFYPVVQRETVPAPRGQVYKAGDTGPAGGIVFSPAAQREMVPAPVTRTYKTGDTGPAGGTVFYSVVQTDTASAPTRRVYKAGDTGPAGGIVFSPAAQRATVPAPQAQVYKVGDTGPAGGIIFYVNPSAGDGWMYLEAAPASSERAVKWGNVTVKGTELGVGEGKKNTEIILAALNDQGENGAAFFCDDLVVNGFDDWFLPSRGELNLMYTRLKEKGLGGFKSETYWSSSDYGNWNYAWYQGFGDGSQNGSGKGDVRSVRAVRAF
jgi:hypothetical protein